MKTIKLPATPPSGVIRIDASVFTSGFTHDPDGADLICGNNDCSHVIFAGYPLYKGGDSMHIEGIQCPSCGWDNTLSTSTIK